MDELVYYYNSYIYKEDQHLNKNYNSIDHFMVSTFILVIKNTL